MAARFRDHVLMDILRRVSNHSSPAGLRWFLQLECDPDLGDVRAHRQDSHTEALGSLTLVFSKLRGHYLPAWNKLASKGTW